MVIRWQGVAIVGSVVAATVIPAGPASAWVDSRCGLWTATASYRHASGLSSVYITANVDAKGLWNSNSDVNFVPAASGQTEKVYMTAYNVWSADYDGLWTADDCNANGHSIGTVNVMLNRVYTDSYSSSGKKQVMVHELGHAIGLGHTGSASCSGQPIMYGSSDRYFTCGHIAPQTDDINGANALV
ncbi:peptidase [Ornithinimicrobium tianjinense]|uniref:Peptidase n=2 Tax=Actinomycetes TaxID=1760 RepID=A0A917F001_9MICO|nr:peptidase [Ornithinimicrobium tianjinense]